MSDFEYLYEQAVKYSEKMGLDYPEVHPSPLPAPELEPGSSE
jgi:hypothetical protein